MARGRSKAVSSTLQPSSRSLVRRFFWAVFLLLDGLVLLAAMVGYGAVYIDPRTLWWGELFAVGLPAIALILLLLSVVPVAMKRWGWVALHAVVLAALALRLVPFERVEPTAPPSDDDLVVMTMNIPRFGPSAEQLAADVVSLLAEESPVFVGLQETVAQHRTQPPFRPTIASYVTPAMDSLGYLLAIPPDWVTHQPVLIRPDAPGELEVVQQTQRTLESGPEDRGASQYVRTRFRWHGREGVHYNIHLRYFGQEKPWEGGIRLFEPGTWLPFLRRYREAYRRRAAEVEEIVRDIEAETLPVIISGDFNATANNWGYHRLAEGRADAFAVAGTGWGGTYRADIPVVRIDHVLVDSAWEVVAAHVPAVTFSDHRPLVVRLRWRNVE